jgi:hypothetical protein
MTQYGLAVLSLAHRQRNEAKRPIRVGIEPHIPRYGQREHGAVQRLDPLHLVHAAGAAHRGVAVERVAMQLQVMLVAGGEEQR